MRRKDHQLHYVGYPKNSHTTWMCVCRLLVSVCANNPRDKGRQALTKQFHLASSDRWTGASTWPKPPLLLFDCVGVFGRFADIAPRIGTCRHLPLLALFLFEWFAIRCISTVQQPTDRVHGITCNIIVLIRLEAQTISTKLELVNNSRSIAM